MNDTAATPEQIAKVLDAIRRLRPFDIGSIMRDTGLENDVVRSAIHSLEQDGTIVGRNPFAYEPTAVDTDPDDAEK